MHFKNQVVSDLAFILQAPLIYQDMAISEFWLSDWRIRLNILDQEPKPLIDKINQCKSHFLGSYFETIFSFAINNLSSFDVIFEHKQLISPDRTLGEIDALVRTQDGKLHQFEVAIKFYLESNRELGHWVGPNKNDSFIKKYDRAKNHQLKVLALPEASVLMSDYNLNEPINAHLLMFGILYNQIAKSDDLTLFQHQPMTFLAAKEEKINQAAKTGFWINEDNLIWLKDDFISAQELFKPHWISDPVEQEVSTQKSLHFSAWQDDIKEKFKQDNRPRHFVIKWKKSGFDSHYTRLFVVSSLW